MKGTRVRTLTNFSGGVQGGISNGEPVVFRVAFKPTATIAKPQQTVTVSGENAELAARGRHDPCVLPRAVPMVRRWQLWCSVTMPCASAHRTASRGNPWVDHRSGRRLSCSQAPSFFSGRRGGGGAGLFRGGVNFAAILVSAVFGLLAAELAAAPSADFATFPDFGRCDRWRRPRHLFVLRNLVSRSIDLQAN